jgi:hypothetical protein
MKTFLALLIGVSTCLADGLSNGKTVGSNSVELIWNVPTNSWPSTLWTYKIVPQSFSPSVISNLMALGCFAEGDKTNIPGKPRFTDDGMSFFSNEKGTRYLEIIQPLGWIVYHDRDADSVKEPSGVPSEDEALRLSTEYLRVFGIDRSQLASRGEQLRTYRDIGRSSWNDEARGKEMEVTNSRGVFFPRKIDGVDFIGLGVQGGVYFNFGSNAKLIDLKINWKCFEPYQLNKTLDGKEVLAKFNRHEGKWNPALENPNNIKKITFTGISAYYRGVSGDDDETTTIKPFGILVANIEYSNTNIVSGWEFQILGTPLNSGDGLIKATP